MKFIIAIIKPFKLDEVREALGAIGVAGMTVSRGQGLRTAEGADRNLSRGGIFHQHAAQGEDRGGRLGRDGRRLSSKRSSRPPAPKPSATARSSSSTLHPPSASAPANPGKPRCDVRVSDRRETTMIRKILCGAGALGASMFAATAAWAQEATAAASAAASEAAATATEAAATATEAAAAAATTMIKAPTVEQMADDGQQGRHRLDAGVLGAGADDEHSGTGVVLRRPRAHQEHAQRADAGVHDRLDRGPRVGLLGLHDRLHQRRRAFIGGFSKLFLAGVSGGTYAATFSNNVYLPEYLS
jgi:hypothetical protein